MSSTEQAPAASLDGSLLDLPNSPQSPNSAPPPAYELAAEAPPTQPQAEPASPPDAHPQPELQPQSQPQSQPEPQPQVQSEPQVDSPPEVQRDSPAPAEPEPAKEIAPVLGEQESAAAEASDDELPGYSKLDALANTQQVGVAFAGAFRSFALSRRIRFWALRISSTFISLSSFSLSLFCLALLSLALFLSLCAFFFLYFLFDVCLRLDCLILLFVLHNLTTAVVV